MLLIEFNEGRFVKPYIVIYELSIHLCILLL